MRAIPQDRIEALRLLMERIDGACLIETDARGAFTYFGAAAEKFFGCSREEAVGKLRYADFHDAAELEACRGTAEFRAAIRDPGWTEDEWRVIPRRGEAFKARVTLVPLWNLDSPGETEHDKPIGWLALYRRAD